jgi:glycosyltransferase EpsF
MVAGSMHVGGLENQIMHLLRKANKDIYQIDFTSDKPDAFFRQEIESYGGDFIELSYKSRKQPIKYSIEMYRIMKKGNYDVVHAHELFHSGLTVFIAWLAGVPCRFVHAHSWREGHEIIPKYTISRKLYHNLMRFLIIHFSTTQIACSTWAARFLFGKKIMKKKSYHLIYNSVDISKYLDNYYKEEGGDYCETDGWRNVINVARFCGLKNHIFLIELAKELKNKNKKIRFLLVGDGDDEEYKKNIVQAVNEYHLKDYIKLLGLRDDVDSLLRKSSAFITPSKYEGMPLVMIEAQAAGLSCVSADTYSHEVDFDLGRVTWLNLSDDTSMWIKAIENAISMERAPKELVMDAIRKKGFDSNIFAEKICGLYNQDFEQRGKK